MLLRVSLILVSNNSGLLRHLSSSAFRPLELKLAIASSGDEALDAARENPPDLAIIDAEMPGLSGYDVAKKLSELAPACRVVLVMGKRISSAQMQRVAVSGCDEVLIAPMSANELYDVVTIQLGLQRHGDVSFVIDVYKLITDDDGTDSRLLDATVTNLSLDGARLITSETVKEQEPLQIIIRFDDEDNQGSPLELNALAVWTHAGEDENVVGASFEGVTSEQRERLARITQWELIHEAERTRIVIKGDITEAVNFTSLLPNVVGRVSFDMSRVRYINSLGVREWVEFLGKATAQGYEFHACSVAFIVQASMMRGVLGRGTVISFFAPYACEVCDHQKDTLLQSATVLAANYAPPTLTCPECDGQMALDDLPDRYLAFLKPKE